MLEIKILKCLNVAQITFIISTIPIFCRLENILIDAHIKLKIEFTDILANGRIY